MRTEALNQRAALLARREAALKRWPNKTGAEFAAELGRIAEDLATLARTMEMADVAPLERLRTWCSAGDTYLITGSDRTALECAAEAYRSAEELAEQALTEAAELLQLKHRYGSALLKLAEGRNAELASEAASRLSSALSLARKHMPVGVATIKLELFRAEHTVTQLRRTRRAPLHEQVSEAA
jgi:hypothetical protein